MKKELVTWEKNSKSIGLCTPTLFGGLRNIATLHNPRYGLQQFIPVNRYRKFPGEKLLKLVNPRK